MYNWGHFDCSLLDKCLGYVCIAKETEADDCVKKAFFNYIKNRGNKFFLLPRFGYKLLSFFILLDSLACQCSLVFVTFF